MSNKIDSSRSVVVYNKFDPDAVISAAYLKSKFPRMQVYDNLMAFSLNKELHYYFLGFSKINSLITNSYNYSSLTETTNDDGIQISILSKILTHFGYNSDELCMTIAEMLPEFKHTDSHHGVSLNIYLHYKKAINTLDSNVPFVFNDKVATYEPFSRIGHEKTKEMAEYNLFIERAKEDLRRYYSADHMITKHENLNVAAASVAGDTCVWVRRMMKMSTGCYLNVVLSVRGHIIDTDISNIRELLPKTEFILSTEI